MEFNYSTIVVPVGGVQVYPDYPYENQAPLPSTIKDSGSIRGNASARGGIVGSAVAQGSLGD